MSALRYRSKQGHITAFCYKNGVIKFTSLKRPYVPKGALPLVSGSPARLRNMVTATARIAYDGKTLLVPGIPEAELFGWDPLTKLQEHIEWLLRRPGFYKAISERRAA